MRFTKLNGLTIKELSHSDLVKALKQRVFSEFMRLGVQGIVSASDTVIEVTLDWYGERGPKLELSREQYNNLFLLIQQALIDGFIKEGTGGLDAPLVYYILAIYDVANENKAQA